MNTIKLKVTYRTVFEVERFCISCTDDPEDIENVKWLIYDNQHNSCLVKNLGLYTYDDEISSVSISVNGSEFAECNCEDFAKCSSKDIPLYNNNGTYAIYSKSNVTVTHKFNISSEFDPYCLSIYGIRKGIQYISETDNVTSLGKSRAKLNNGLHSVIVYENEFINNFENFNEETIND